MGCESVEDNSIGPLHPFLLSWSGLPSPCFALARSTTASGDFARVRRSARSLDSSADAFSRVSIRRVRFGTFSARESPSHPALDHLGAVQPMEQMAGSPPTPASDAILVVRPMFKLLAQDGNGDAICFPGPSRPPFH